MRKRLLSTKEVGNRKGLNYLQKNNEAESEVREKMWLAKIAIPAIIFILVIPVDMLSERQKVKAAKAIIAIQILLFCLESFIVFFL